MKTRLIAFIFVITAGFGNSFAEKVLIGDLYYNLDALTMTAEVTYNNNTSANYSLQSITIPPNVTYNNNTYNVTSIGNYAFRNCTYLTSVTIPNSVTSIGNNAFYDCSGLTSITIPNSVTSIGVGAFHNSGITAPVYNDKIFAYLPQSYSGSYSIPNGIETIAGDAFSDCTGLTSITIPNSVTSIGYGAFLNCTSLTSITIPNSVTSIGNGAFVRCTDLTSITIPNSVTSIGYSAFDECKSLTSVTIPNSVISIGFRAFGCCTSLTSITIPSSVTSIGENAFFNCTGLMSFVVEDSNAIYDSRNNCNAIIETSTNTLIAGCANTIIPNSVTSIGYGAFLHCTRLTSITIPNSVTSIGICAFLSCSDLTHITIPNSVTSIGYGAFCYCTSLSSITCEASLPPSLCDDDSYYDNFVAVQGGLSNANVSCASSVFDYVAKSISLYVPKESMSAYQQAEGWKDFTNIQPISAESTTTTTAKVTPTETTAEVVWPVVNNAATYEIAISKNGVVICTLTFNEQGQLLNIAFAAPAMRNEAAETQAAGFKFTVNSLDPGTTYNYSVVAKNASDVVIDTKSGSFITLGGTGIDEITNHQSQFTNQKLLHDGQIYIIRGEKIFNLQGAEVK